jgi:hypothetical protein
MRTCHGHRDLLLSQKSNQFASLDHDRAVSHGSIEFDRCVQGGSQRGHDDVSLTGEASVRMADNDINADGPKGIEHW